MTTFEDAYPLGGIRISAVPSGRVEWTLTARIPSVVFRRELPPALVRVRREVCIVTDGIDDQGREIPVGLSIVELSEVQG